MTAVRRRAVAALVLMLLALAGAQVWKPTRHLSDERPKLALDAVFPRSFAGWVVDDRMPVQLVAPDQQAVLNRIYNQTLSRTYVNRSGMRVMLSVAYGGDQSDATRAHRPEVCYPSQGFQILSDQLATVPVGAQGLPARQLVARQGGRIEPITYWVTVGDRVALSGTQQKLAQLAYSTRGLIPDGMLVRVSTIDNDPARAYAAHAAFIQELAGVVSGDARSRVFGEAGSGS